MSNALHSSETNEWYTPADVVERAHKVLGAIDLDPASCEAANHVVRAERYFTKADDGLSMPWSGRVWLNPPYGRGEGNRSNQGIWSGQLIGRWVLGEVESALLLVNAVPDRKWFRLLWGFPVCFLYERLRFVDGAGNAGPSPTHGNAIVYLTDCVIQEKRFEGTFSEIGHVVIPSLDKRTNRLRISKK